MNYIVSGNGTMTIVVNNESHTVGYDHPNYLAIKECLVANDVVSLIPLLNIPESLVNYSEGKVEISNGILKYEGEEIHNTLADRVMSMMRDGFPFKPMLNFLTNVLDNPSNRAVQELYTFLEHKNLPITDDGCFLAYKAVTHDYKDKWSGTIDNSVGQQVGMKRRKVDDNCDVGCSEGLHWGAIEYVEGYSRITGDPETDDKVVIVKVNPRDVVSVPLDCECQKVRTCSYEVVADYEGPLNQPVHHQNSQEWSQEDFARFMSAMMGQEDREEYDEQDWTDHGYDPDLN